MAMLTLADVFRRHAERARAEIAARDAYDATPEGAAEKAEREAHHKRMAEADARFAEENPPEDDEECEDDEGEF